MAENAAYRAMIQKLQSLERAGVAQIGRSRTLAGSADATDSSEPAVQSVPATSVPVESSAAIRLSNRSLIDTESPENQAMSLEERHTALKVLQEEVAGCTRCDDLVANRTQTVFGVGNPNPRLCFFGEGPGADEDKTGEPFVGRAGQLLNKIIEACKMKRDDVYILNVVKCRPPGNRNPATDEIASCRGFFERQLEILQPEFICCLGTVAAQALLETKQSIGRLRGSVHNYRDIKVVATYHPAYLLRNPAAKKDTWEDMKLLLSEMGIEL